MFGLSVSEIAVILVVALVVFGPEKLPEFARTLGRAAGYFRRTVDELRHELSLDPLEAPPIARRTSSLVTESNSSQPTPATQAPSTPAQES